jgi:hypothetical protein
LSRYSPSWLDICALINIIGTSAHRLTADPLSRKIQLLYLTQLVADPEKRKHDLRLQSSIAAFGNPLSGGNNNLSGTFGSYQYHGNSGVLSGNQLAR